ncbi:MAG TPA: BON domain-containing protein [Vitreimonas sp.]|uniref:BON domain-containing protein n=1 Tax=Vitreimonas sp. TaxID=3069702 RepID=UPI002D3D4F0C|nr:BON domain-containing protein [Vitreimonas sp.]HYD89663.1 BON domain-containing protein [Vitreimonas sp.]
MQERHNWWQPDDTARRDYAKSGRRDYSARHRDDRPYWWSENDLPRRDERIRYDADRQRDDRRGYARDHDDVRHGGHDVDSDYHDGRSRLADQVKAFFGSDRAERRLEHDRRYHDDDRRHARRYEDDARRDFRGVGPRTRHDEDEELREQLSDRFADDPELDASEILVRVIDNEAILDGTVRSKRDAQRAYDIAHDIPGIVYVRDRLDVVSRRGRDRVRRATVGMGYEGSTRRWS